MSGTSTRHARRRALARVIGGQVFVLTASAGVRLALPLMMLKEGGMLGLGGAMSAGLVVALFAMVPVFTAMPAGRWVDRRGYHRPTGLVVLMSVLGALLAVPAGLMGDPAVASALDHAGPPLLWEVLRAALLVACAGVFGTGVNLSTICVQRTVGRLATLAGDDAASQRTPEQEAEQTAELKRAFAWLGLGPSASNTLGPLLAGVCIDLLGFAWTFLLMALLPLGTWLTSRHVPREVSDSPTATQRPRSRGWAGIRELLDVRHMRRLLLINWLFIGSWDLFAFLVPLHGHTLGLQASAIGLVLGIFSAAIIAVRVLLPLFVNRVEDAVMLAGALALMGVGFGLFPLATNALLMTLFACVIGLGLGVLQPMILTTLYRITPLDRQGEALGFRMVCINLSSSVLPLCFGALGAAAGAALMFRGMAVLLLAGARLPLGLRGNDRAAATSGGSSGGAGD